MTKKEAAKELRSLLTKALRSLPDDVEYASASVHEDYTMECEQDTEVLGTDAYHGNLHLIELIVEETPTGRGFHDEQR